MIRIEKYYKKLKRSLILIILFTLLTSCNQVELKNVKNVDNEKNNKEEIIRKWKKEINIINTSDSSLELNEDKNKQKISNNDNEIKSFLENYYFKNELNKECSFINLIEYYNRDYVSNNFPFYLRIYCVSYSYNEKELRNNKSINETILLLKENNKIKVLRNTIEQYKEYDKKLYENFDRDKLKNIKWEYNLDQKLIDEVELKINKKWKVFKNS